LTVICAVLLAAGLTFVTNRIALIPWRRSKDKHWSEQARVVYPVFVAARSNLLSVPAVLTLGVLLLWPESSPLWLITGIVSVLAAYLGTFPLDLEVFPRISLTDLLFHAAIGCTMQFLLCFVFLGATVMMPNQFNYIAWAIGAVVLIMWVIWTNGGFIWLGRRLGLFQVAPDRLLRIVFDTSARMNISFREVLMMRSPLAQALAFPRECKLMFTQRLLDLLSDEEVSAVCAHELAHFTESKMSQLLRSMRILIYLPWVFFNPLIHAFGQSAFFVLCGITVLGHFLFRKLSRKLESRADRMAKANEGDSGTYATALTKLYADNLVPAVTAKNRSTHPHLYDRLLSAGIVPDFPRPAPASAMAWNGLVFAGLTGGLFAVFVLRLMGVFNGGL
jgi:Zn-dependent protease with chaperone function